KIILFSKIFRITHRKSTPLRT
ncbi:hypothetical protein TNCT_331431, partial [Trichonephila clavata]